MTQLIRRSLAPLLASSVIGLGAGLIGFDGAAADKVLEQAKPMANYTALRAYTGRALGVRITAPGLAGMFQRDDADVATADNGGTVIVDASGRRWKRLYDGGVWVRWFGAKGDGATFDSDAIEAAQAVSQIVNFGPGQFRISRPIIWLNSYLLGHVENGLLSLSQNQTMILADGTFAAFQYKHPDGYVSHGGGIKNFVVLFADGEQPATVATRPNAIGYLCDGTKGYPAFYTIENLTVRGGQWAIFDQSGSWMGKWKHIHSEKTIAGIFKRYGTTHTLESCYHGGGKAGYWFQDVLGVTINSCAIDLVQTDVVGYYPLFVENSNVVWNGGDFEGVKVLGDQQQIAYVNGASAVLQVNGARFFATEVTAASEQYIVRATNGAKVELRGIAFDSPVYHNAGGVFAYLVAQSGASISISGGTLPAVTAGAAGHVPATAYAGLANGGDIDYSAVTTTYAWGGTARAMDKSIRAAFVYDFQSLAAGASITLVFDVPGAAMGDFVEVAMSIAVPGLVFEQKYVSLADKVTLVAKNVSGASLDPPSATLRFKVTKQ